MKVTISAPFGRVQVELPEEDAAILILDAVRKAAEAASEAEFTVQSDKRMREELQKLMPDIETAESPGEQRNSGEEGGKGSSAAESGGGNGTTGPCQERNCFTCE